MSGPPVDLRRAAAVLHLHRHRLNPDRLRTIQNVWVCASAARYGRPFETGWAEDPDAYSDHDVSECEADDDAADLADIGASAGTMPPFNLQEIARRLEQDLRANRRPGITDANELDVQALCVAGEAGELVGTYRRYAGSARRAGTRRELENEVADVLIVAAVFAERARIDMTPPSPPNSRSSTPAAGREVRDE